MHNDNAHTEPIIIGDATLYCGDCLEILPTLGKVDAVITDPPYGVNIADWDGDVPYKMLSTFLDIARFSVVWFGSAPRVIEDAKSFPIEPDRMMIWSPKFTLSKIAKDGFAYRFHPIWFWRIRKQSHWAWDLFNDNTECGNDWEHKCTKPVELMKNLVGCSSMIDETILDPFMGSGTTGVAALKLGRKFIGIEIDPTYFEIAVNRIKKEANQLKLF